MAWAKHMKVDLTGEGFLSDVSSADTCPVCGGEISYEPHSIEDINWDTSYLILHTTCPKCGSQLSASYDYHDTQVNLDGRFTKED